MKKIIVFVLVLIMLLGYLPQGIVLANIQSNVDNLRIEYINNKLSFNWVKPSPVLDADPTLIHDIMGYDLYMRNASTPQSYPAAPFLKVPLSTDQNFNQPLPANITLEDGSFYSFRILPYHKHAVITQDQDGNDVTTLVDIYPSSTASSPYAESAFLTDFEVFATGSIDSITVEWNNPEFDGNVIFDNYVISYIPYHENSRNFSSNYRNDSYRVVSISDAEVKTLPNGKLSYTIYDDKLMQGAVYAVKVDPMYNNQIFRTGASKEINVSGRTFPINVYFSNNEYRYNDVVIELPLEVTTENGQVKLSWPSLSMEVGGVNSTVREVIIYEQKADGSLEPPRPLITLRGDTAKLINTWYTPIPETPVNYYILAKFFNSGTNLVTEVPSVIVYYVPGEYDYTSYKPQIFDAKRVEGSVNHEIMWEAFLRFKFSDNDVPHVYDDETPPRYWEQDIDYSIIISDSMQAFDASGISNFATTLNYTKDKLIANDYMYQIKTDGDTIKTKAYSNLFSTYAAFDEAQNTLNPEPQAFEENKVYYVQIIATRPGQKESVPAYFSWYMYPTGAVPSSPVMISKPPLSVKDVNETNFTIQWDTKWYEVYDDDSKTWYSLIGVAADGELVFGNDTDTLEDSRKMNLAELPVSISNAEAEEHVIDFISSLTGKANDSQYKEDLKGMLVLRLMDLVGSKYAIHVVEFDTLFEQGGYDKYYEDNLKFPDNISAWSMNIKASETPDGPEYMINSVHFPKAGSVEKNKSYVVYFLPYLELQGGGSLDYFSYYPSYLVVTTESTRPPLDPDPTVPVLVGVDPTTHTTITVKWRYNEDFQYELRYSDLLTGYPESGTIVTNEMILTDNQPVTEVINGENVKFIYYTIKNLFPDTRYYFWLRATSIKSSGQSVFKYSNPIDLKTKTVDAPLPPQGLGLISVDHLDTYNKEKALEYKRSDNDYIIAEWLRNPEDTEQLTISANIADAEMIHSASFKITYAVKFNSLVANRQHYIRVKTKLSVYKDGEAIKEAYTYVVQIANNEEFLDFTEIEVPTTIAQKDIYFIVKESDWSNPVTVYTRPSTGEYDGDKDPNMYPLPTDDFEIIYNPSTDTLTYRFRSNQTDSQGNADNLVDQRFISRLIATKAFNFSIDVTKYNNMAVANRTIILPYTIIEAFNQRKISFSIISDNLTITMPPGWLASSGVTIGAGSSVTINLSNAAAKITSATGGGYVSAPQQLSVSVKTPSRTVSLERSANNMNIALKLNNRYLTYDKNIAGYIHTPQSGTWQRQNSTYDNLSGVVSFQTSQIGSYSAIGLNTPQVEYDDSSNSSMYNVTTKIAITDLTVYNPSMSLSSAQFNNLLAAVSEGAKSFALNGSLSSASYNALSKSGMLASGSVVTREQGIASLVKLYENKTRSTVKDYDSITQTPYADIQNSDVRYLEAMLKAGSLGFLNGSSSNPKEPLTLGDALFMVDLLMQDAGL